MPSPLSNPLSLSFLQHRMLSLGKFPCLLRLPHFTHTLPRILLLGSTCHCGNFSYCVVILLTHVSPARLTVTSMRAGARPISFTTIW